MLVRKRPLRAVLLLALLASAAALPAQDAAPKVAVLFKSGQAWLEREAVIPSARADVLLDLPEALHGTIWLGSPSHRIVRARGLKATRAVTRPAHDLAGLLLASEGRKVVVTVVIGGETREHRGTVGRSPRPKSGPPSLLRLDQENGGHHLVALSRVAQVDYLDGEPPLNYQDLVPCERIEARVEAVEEGAKEGALRLGWMAGGLAWAPSWHLALDGKRGRLFGKAVVINDALDLRETQVRLVVGFPNLRFGHVSTPLAPALSFDAFRKAIVGGAAGPSPAVLGQSVLYNAISPAQQMGWGQRDRGPAPNRPLPSDSAEDLWVFDAGKLDLKKGERAYLPLLEQEVEVAHRYDWKLQDHVDAQQRFRAREAEAPVIWHQLVLKNASKTPWTTAPILISGEQGPLAQSQLDYTPAGTDAEVPLTHALDLVPEELYVVESREREPVRYFGRVYEEITVAGTLVIRSRKSETVKVRVTKALGGELLEDGGATRVVEEVKSLRDINPRKTLVWEFELKPGAEWRATFKHRVSVRR